jgi:hypothetical protein
MTVWLVPVTVKLLYPLIKLEKLLFEETSSLYVAPATEFQLALNVEEVTIDAASGTGAGGVELHTFH